MQIIKDLIINDSNYIFSKSEQNNLLKKLSRVNIFVGENNSGKSKFLRSILYYKGDLKLKFLPMSESFNYFLSQSDKLKSNSDKNINRKNVYEFKAYNNIIDYIPNKNYLVEDDDSYNQIIDLYNDINGNDILNEYGKYCEKIFEDFFPNLIFSDKLFNYNFYKVYIPSFRSLIPFASEDSYANRVKNDYFDNNINIISDINNNFSENESKNAIITGFYFYQYVRNYLLGDLKKRKIIADYQDYLSENFFNNDDVALIPKLDDDVLTVKIGNEKEQPIYNLGEGIQAIILITLPLFLYLEKSEAENTNILFFIEEPEVGLHPELQRKLINTFLDEKFDNYQFFFTTHSNHFIDKIFEEEDISIYLFDKNVDDEEESIAKFNIEKVSFDNFSVINKLGALPSSVLQSNCTILVEGISDVIHYRLYLDLYQKHMQTQNSKFEKYYEKTHFSFMIGGGSSIKNSIDIFNRLDKEKILFIFDCDSKTNKQKLNEFLEKNNCKYFYILPVIEVENLISKKSLLDILNDINEFEDVKITDEFDEKEYQKSMFFEFIKNNILLESPKKLISSKKLKKLLSMKERDFTNNYEDLSDEAKKIGKEIYNFIKLNNS